MKGYVSVNELIDKIKKEGILGNGYNDSEREEDVISMIESCKLQYIFTENSSVGIKGTISEFRYYYSFLSNFYESPVYTDVLCPNGTYEKVYFKTNESAFQSQKCLDYDNILLFKNLSASESKKLGRRKNKNYV